MAPATVVGLTRSAVTYGGQMAIARVSRRQPNDLQSEDAFIEGKALPRTLGKRANKVLIMLRIDPELLAEITR